VGGGTSFLVRDGLKGERLQVGRPIFHAVTLAGDGNDISAVQETIKDCGGKHLVADNAAPVAKARVAGEDAGALTIADIDELKEELRAFRGETSIADLVDDEQRWTG